MDEPTSGLDPNQIRGVRQLIRELGKSKTVLVSTHILQEVEPVADRVLFIHDGKIVFDGKPAELAQEGRQPGGAVPPPDGTAGLMSSESASRRRRTRATGRITAIRGQRRRALDRRWTITRHSPLTTRHSTTRGQPTVTTLETKPTSTAAGAATPPAGRRPAVPPPRDPGGLQAQLPELLQQPRRLRLHHAVRARQLRGRVLAGRRSSPTTWRTSTRSTGRCPTCSCSSSRRSR